MHLPITERQPHIVHLIGRACAFNVRNTPSLLQCRKHRILLAYVLIITDTAVSIIWRRTSSSSSSQMERIHYHDVRPVIYRVIREYLFPPVDR